MWGLFTVLCRVQSMSIIVFLYTTYASGLVYNFKLRRRHNHYFPKVKVNCNQENVTHICKWLEICPYSMVQDYTRAGIIRHHFLSLFLRTFIAWKLKFFHTGLSIQLTLTSMIAVFHSYRLRVLKWKLWKNGA